MKICPNCGTENNDYDSFCENCGALLDGSVTTTTTTTASGDVVSGNSQTLTAGAQLQNGRYVIQKILGQGGMGSLALASDTRLAGKRVVIKQLISEHGDSSEDARNFQREVQTLAQLAHPLIPGVTDQFDEGAYYFMVQEYVEGEDLQTRMERIKRPMGEQDALKYTAQVLDVLDYLEQQKPPIVHRDIKPANIVISTQDQRAHLVDFGIARAYAPTNAQRKQTTALGTPGYAPPEQYQGNAEPRSDLYALAATLYFLLTNHDPTEYPPFQFPPARALNPLLSKGIEEVLARALVLDITQRYQTALEMKRDIDAILFNFDKSGNISADSIDGYTSTVSSSPTPARQIPNFDAYDTAGTASSYPSGQRQQQQFFEMPLSRPVNRPPVTPFQPVNRYNGQRQQSSMNQSSTPNLRYVFLMFVFFIIMLGLVAAFVLSNIHP